MSEILEFDGTFEGFLTLVAFTYEIRVMPERIITPDTILGLFDESFVIQTKPDLANRVYEAIKTKFSPKHLEMILYTWLYDDPPLFQELLTFIRLGFQEAQLCNDITKPSVKAIHDAFHYVGREKHKLYGFTRFMQLEDKSYYAKISPKSNVISLLGTHFKERFDDPWIIHDTKRHIALIHRKGDLSLHHVAHTDQPVLHKDEAMFQHLWRQFFKQIAIKERHNPKLQRHFIPMFYRDLMCEFT